MVLGTFIDSREATATCVRVVACAHSGSRVPRTPKTRKERASHVIVPPDALSLAGVGPDGLRSKYHVSAHVGAAHLVQRVSFDDELPPWKADLSLWRRKTQRSTLQPNCNGSCRCTHYDALRHIFQT